MPRRRVAGAERVGWLESWCDRSKSKGRGACGASRCLATDSSEAQVLSRSRTATVFDISPMPNPECVATAVAHIAEDLSEKLQIPKETDRNAVLCDGLRRACELVLVKARDQIAALERQSGEHRHVVEQMQDLIDSLIEKPK